LSITRPLRRLAPTPSIISSQIREGLKDTRFTNQLDDQHDLEINKMQYFTPELVLRLNSSDGKDVDEAMEQWEKAVKAYRKKLQRVQRQLPSHSRRLAELSFHDWNVLGVWSNSDTDKSASPAYVVLNQNDEFVILGYLLTDHLHRTTSVPQWTLSKQQVHWLYDELDVVANKSFTHQILLSDGTTLQIPFSDCQVMPLKLSHVMSRSDLMQVA
jgi:hypothetical protein